MPEGEAFSGRGSAINGATLYSFIIILWKQSENLYWSKMLLISNILKSLVVPAIEEEAVNVRFLLSLLPLLLSYGPTPAFFYELVGHDIYCWYFHNFITSPCFQAFNFDGIIYQFKYFIVHTLFSYTQNCAYLWWT